MEQNVDGLSFDEWMNQVDGILMSSLGISHYELEDYRYYDAWEDGDSPKQAAQDAMDNDETYAMFFGG